jgi:subtilisin family serine protease
MTTEFNKFGFHGTATAGVIAHDNPDVRLVLVQRELGDRVETERNFPCIQQKDLDSTVALLSDPEVREAYIHAPRPRGEADLQAALERHNVGVVNLSFGQISRLGLEQLQASKGCPAVDLQPYFAIVSETERARAAAAGGRALLRVHAAGNDGAEVNSPADLIECAPGDLRNVLVGSTDLAQQRSVFSNWGGCVDLAAPGEDVITTYAGGWLVNAFGTSFAAPLVARLVSTAPADEYQPTSARTALLDRRTPDGSLAIGTFPRNFFYNPPDGVTPTAKALAATATVNVFPTRAMPAVRTPPPPADLSRVLAPVRQIGALSRLNSAR